MSRSVASAAVLLTLATVVVTAQDQPRPAEKSQNIVELKSAAPLAARQAELIRLLHKTISVEQEFMGVPLGEVLSFVSDRWGVSSVINETAYRETGLQTLGEQSVRVPKMAGITLRYLLDHVADQVGGVFLIRGAKLELVPRGRAMIEVYGKASADDDDLTRRQQQPLVHAAFANSTLAAALAELSETSGRNVILDPRVKDQANSLVTLRLVNTPLDTAVNVLAKFNDLVAVQLDTTFVVTTPRLADGVRNMP